jgi:hypothetical protein
MYWGGLERLSKKVGKGIFFDNPASLKFLLKQIVEKTSSGRLIFVINKARPII